MKIIDATAPTSWNAPQPALPPVANGVAHGSAPLRPLPDSFATTRDTLQRVATHILARRRHQLCGKLGLRVAPGGIGTPSCGPDHEVLRISGTRLIREVTGSAARTTALDLAAATLEDAAELADVDLSAPFDAGHDTPSMGDPGSVLDVDAASADALAAWFRFGWAVLDETVAGLGPAAESSVVQLWPEHFDAGINVAAGSAGRVNLGVSPGDAYSEQPYLYVGPWGPDRPGDPSYWNAPFGATLAYDRLLASAEPLADGAAFLVRGVDLLGGGSDRAA
jgi:hypothetical protein